MSLTAGDFQILALTLKVAVVATACILPPGIALAWTMSRWRSSFNPIIETIVSLPLVLPPTAVGIILLGLLAPHGPLGSVLGTLGIKLLFTWKAVAVASAIMSFPLLVRPARAAFEEIDPRLEAVARTLGWSRLAVFARVDLPMAWRGLVTGTLLAFSRALGEFGATIIIAGNIPGRTQTLALAIFQRAETGNDADAFRLVEVTIVLAFAAVVITEAVSYRHAKRTAA